MAGVTIVSELGINHGGSGTRAHAMIEAAKACGCDAVKVQSYRCADFLPEGHPDWEMFEQCEIWPWLRQLADHAHCLGLQFGVTPQSVAGVHEAVEIGADYLKNGSDCLLRTDMIAAMCKTGLPVWVSTGMSDWREILSLPESVNLMLCTSLYPCPDDQAGLGRLRWGLYRGFSDHTQGALASAIAVGCGVTMIEKHFTLDHELDGPDHWFSADPYEMKKFVKAVRKAETLRGSRLLGFTPGEVEGREKYRTRPGELRAA